MFIPRWPLCFHLNCSVKNKCAFLRASGPSLHRAGSATRPGSSPCSSAGSAWLSPSPAGGERGPGLSHVPIQPGALPRRLRHSKVLSRSQDPDMPLSKELCMLGSEPACDFPVARVQWLLPLALADARKTFCNPGKFPVLTLQLTGWQHPPPMASPDWENIKQKARALEKKEEGQREKTGQTRSNFFSLQEFHSVVSYSKYSKVNRWYSKPCWF